MPDIFDDENELQLFTDNDVYFYAVDNRPLRFLAGNDIAIAAELTEVKEKLRTIATFTAESPVAEDYVGGMFVAEYDGQITHVGVTVGVAGSGDDFLVDVKINGVSIYSDSGDRPLLAHDAPTRSVTSDIDSGIDTGTFAAGDRVSVEFVTIQAGTPRHARVDVSCSYDIENQIAAPMNPEV